MKKKHQIRTTETNPYRDVERLGDKINTFYVPLLEGSFFLTIFLLCQKGTEQSEDSFLMNHIPSCLRSSTIGRPGQVDVYTKQTEHHPTTVKTKQN